MANVVQLLKGLATADDAVRTAAERTLYDEFLGKAPFETAFLLAQAATDASAALTTDARTLAAVLLKRILFKPYAIPALAAKNEAESGSKTPATLWASIPTAEMKDGLMEMLLRALVLPAAALPLVVRHKIADAVAECARIKKGVFPALIAQISAVFSDAHSEEPQRLSFLRILHTYPPLLRQLPSASVQQLFSSTLAQAADSSATSDAFVTAVVKAFAAYAVSDASRAQSSLAPCVATLLTGAVSRLVAQRSAMLTETLGALCDVAEEAPKLFKPHVGVLLGDALLERIFLHSAAFDEGTVQTAVELFVCICERLPAAARRHLAATDNRLLRVLLDEFLPHAADADDDADAPWYACATLDECDDDDADNMHVVACHALDRIALALGGRVVLPVIFAAIQRWASSSAWQHRRAALMTIAYAAEGCADALEAHIDAVMQLIVASFSDGHPRVQHAACHVLGQLCTDFSDCIQQRFHAQAVSCLVGALRPDSHPRVASHAASALVNFCDEAEAAVLHAYLEHIVVGLLNLLRSPKIYAQEQAISTLSVVADVAGSDAAFVQAAASIVPPLMHVIRAANDAAFRRMRAKAIDAVTLVALAIGREAIGSEVINELVGVMHTLQTRLDANTDADDPTAVYLPTAWVRMCQLLGVNFNSLLPVVFPSLLNAVRVEADIALLDADDELTAEQQTDDWEFATVHGKKIGIKTSVLEEKAAAIANAEAYARVFAAVDDATQREAFAPYAAQVFAAVVPLVEYDYHEGVKSAAASCIPALFAACRNTNIDAFLMTHLAQAQQALVDALAAASAVEEADFVGVVLNALADLWQQRGREAAALLPSGFAPISETLVALLKEINAAIAVHFDDDAGDDEAGDAEDSQICDVEALLINVSSFVQTALGVFGAAFAEAGVQAGVFSLFLGGGSSSSGMLQSSRPAVRLAAVLVAGEVLEQLDALEDGVGPSLDEMVAHIAKRFYDMIFDADSDVRQAVCFGVGVAATRSASRRFGSVLRALCDAASQRLFALASHADARSSENVEARDNAVAAIAKIHTHLPATATSDSVETWMRFLPATADEKEIAVIYAHFFAASLQFAGRWAQSAANAAPHEMFVFVAGVVEDVLQRAAAAPSNASLAAVAREAAVFVPRLRSMLPSADAWSAVLRAADAAMLSTL